MLVKNMLTEPGGIKTLVLRKNEVLVTTQDGKNHLFLRNDTVNKQREAIDNVVVSRQS